MNQGQPGWTPSELTSDLLRRQNHSQPPRRREPNLFEGAGGDTDRCCCIDTPRESPTWNWNADRKRQVGSGLIDPSLLSRWIHTRKAVVVRCYSTTLLPHIRCFDSKQVGDSGLKNAEDCCRLAMRFRIWIRSGRIGVPFSGPGMQRFELVQSAFPSVHLWTSQIRTQPCPLLALLPNPQGSCAYP